MVEFVIVLANAEEMSVSQVIVATIGRAYRSHRLAPPGDADRAGHPFGFLSEVAIHSILRCLLLAYAFGMSLPAIAATTVYHCTVNGQTVLTDRPCDSPPAAVVGEDGRKSISGSPTVVGQWRGQTQYQGMENGQLIAAAHSVVVLALTFTDDGKVSGSSPENGCGVLGIWSQGLTPRLFNLDLTLNGCRYASFDRRYSGSYVTIPQKLAGQLFLQAYTLPVPGLPVRRYDLAGTLRR